MAKRFTDTEKWEDPWFLERSPKAKTLFCYLCDKCDMAGFYERNDKMSSFYTGIEIEEIPTVLQELVKSVVVRDRWVFVKNFMRHQKNLPLNPDNNAHKAAIKSLEDKKHLFSDIYKEINLGLVRGLPGAKKGLVSPIGKGNGKDKGKGNGLSLKPLATIVPDDLKEDESSILDWLEYKKQRGQTYKPKGLEAFFRTFRAIPKGKRREAVDHSMSNNWSGLFEKNGGIQSGQKAGNTQTDKFKGVGETIEL